ncbi:MAG: 50S ribosomal protein L30 [Pseudomonadota bacterium]|nr:50S ribosomal protein L30 [Pseudomonadota bacterium]
MQSLKVKLIKSTNGLTAKQKSSVKGLGLRKINSEVTVANTPENRGMVNKVIFLLSVEGI